MNDVTSPRLLQPVQKTSGSSSSRSQNSNRSHVSLAGVKASLQNLVKDLDNSDGNGSTVSSEGKSIKGLSPMNKNAQCPPFKINLVRA